MSYIDRIQASAESLFYHFFSVSPAFGRGFYSIFRNDDKRPDCRFEVRSGKIYFVDNRGYHGKIYFDIIDAVAHQYGISVKEAISRCLAALEGNVKKVPEMNRTYEKVSIDNKDFLIDHKPWTEDNYYTKYYRLPLEFLKTEPLTPLRSFSFLVNNVVQWLRVPPHGFQISYPSGHKSVYIPESKPKILSLTDENDIYGIDRPRLGDTLFIASSAKETKCLYHHGGVDSVSPFVESHWQLSEKFINHIRSFPKRVLWYDADAPGVENMKRVQSFLKTHDIETEMIIHKIELGDDCAELIRNQHFTYFINLVKNYV